MLAEQHGCKSVWRKPAKALLFFFLLAALSAVLALGLCIYSAVSGFLADCDDYFRTIAVLEYIGQDYNDDTRYDESLCEALLSGEVDVQSMAALDGALRWEPSRSALGVAEGYTATQRPDEDQDYAVLVVSNLFWEEHGGCYQGVIRESLYSARDVEGKMIFLAPDALEGGLDLDASKIYVFAGRFISGVNSYLWFLPESVELADAGVIAAAQSAADGVAEDSPYRRAAEAFARRANGLRVVMTGALEDLYPFQQQELSITAGRTFTDEEYASGAHVCVMPQALAGLLGADVGDTVELSLYYSVSDGIYSYRQLGQAPDVKLEYQLVGLCSSQDACGDWVFIPDSAEYQPDAYPTGYTIGQFRLDNRRSSAFYASAQEMLPAGFRLTLYDQGYATAAAPFQQLLRIAQIFLAVCVLVILAVLALYGYLFVYRRRETALTMIALGTGKWHVYRYFAAGSVSILLPASAAGVLLGRSLERRVLQYVAAFAARYQAQDLRYSSAALSITKTLQFQPDPPASLFLLAALFLLSVTLAVGAVFTGRILAKKQRRRRRPHRVPHGARISKLSGFFQYPLVSIRRGGVRTVSILALVILVSLFLGQLAGTQDVYREQLAAVERDTRIRGYASDYRGLSMDKLTIPTALLQQLYETGLVETLDVASGGTYHYRIEGIAQKASGETYNIPMTKLPESTFALETFSAQMSREPLICCTSSLTNSAEFYYGAEAPVTWLDGYDESCLRGEDFSICLLPQSVMEREGVALGDTIQLFLFAPDADPPTGFSALLMVVGSYLPQGVAETIYLPLGYRFPLGSEPGVTVERPAAAARDFSSYRYGELKICFSDPYNRDEDVFLSFASQQRSAKFLTFSDYTSAVNAFFRAKGLGCVIRAELREALGLEFGDTLCLTRDDGQVLEYPLLGEFQSCPELTDDLYCSMPPTAVELTGMYDETYLRENLRYYNACSAIFTVRSTADLPALRDALEKQNFSKVRSTSGNRTYIVLDDKDFCATVSSMQRQIRYMDALYRCLYVLTGLIGLAVSWLLLAARRQEIAIMRGLGTQPLRTFGSFWIEQLILLLLGCGLGLGLWALTGQPLTQLQILLTAAFFTCWMFGTAASLLRQISSRALAALADRE